MIDKFYIVGIMVGMKKIVCLHNYSMDRSFNPAVKTWGETRIL